MVFEDNLYSVDMVYYVHLEKVVTFSILQQLRGWIFFLFSYAQDIMPAVVTTCLCSRKKKIK